MDIETGVAGAGYARAGEAGCKIVRDTANGTMVGLTIEAGQWIPLHARLHSDCKGCFTKISFSVSHRLAEAVLHCGLSGPSPVAPPIDKNSG